MDPAQHVVVFDVNIYLDVAELLGPPFEWSRLAQTAAQLVDVPVPHPSDARYDSLRAIAACSTGTFAGRHTLQVWTSSHIDGVARRKATQPDDEARYAEDRGLGWSEEHAQTLVDELIGGIVERSGGDTIGDVFPFGEKAVGHEDGLVYGACKMAMDEDLIAERWCVTRDNDFLCAELPGHARVLHPAKFLAVLRAARARISTRTMAPRRPNPPPV